MVEEQPSAFIVKSLALRTVSEFADTHYLCLKLEYVFHFLVAAVIFSLVLIYYKKRNRYLLAFQITTALIFLKEFVDFIFWIFRDIRPPITFLEQMYGSISDIFISIMGIVAILLIRRFSALIER